MSKFRPEERRYFQTGVSGYIGSGNNPLVYSKRAAPSFARLKQLYGDHLENYNHKELTHKEKKEISAELKQKIRDQIKKENIALMRKRIIALFISVVILVILVFIISKVIFLIFPSLE